MNLRPLACTLALTLTSTLLPADRALALLIDRPITLVAESRQLLTVSSNGRFAVTTDFNNLENGRLVDLTSGSVVTSLPTSSFIGTAASSVAVTVNDTGTTVFASVQRSLVPADADDDSADVYRFDAPSYQPQLVTGSLAEGWDYAVRAASSDSTVLALSRISGGFGDLDVLRYDLVTGDLSNPERTLSPLPNTVLQSRDVSMSADGNALAFIANTGAGGAYWHAFAYRHSTATTQIVDRTAAGTAANRNAGSPLISGDGQMVAFQSSATNLSSGTTHGIQVLRLSDGVMSPVAAVGTPVSISMSGARIAYNAEYNSDVFVLDREADTGGPLGDIVAVVSTPDGSLAFHGIYRPTLTADGSQIFFETMFDILGNAPEGGLYRRELPLQPFVAQSPSRLLDTRPGGSTIDGRHRAVGRLAAGATYVLPVVGRAGVSGSPRAVVLNVTVTDPAGDGYLTVWPCTGATPPNASNLNFAAGQTIANAVIVGLSQLGSICLRTSEAATHALVDLTGVLTVDADFRPVEPSRLLDSRPTGQTIDGKFAALGRFAAGERREIAVAGRGGVPAGATAAVLNVTVTDPTGGGYLTVWPCDSTAPPNSSNLNFVSGQTVPNLVIAPLSASGTVCIQTAEAAAHVLADVSGYFTAGKTYIPRSPARVADTRPGTTTIDGQAAGIGIRRAGTRFELPIDGRAGTPGAARAAILNVTATGATGTGYLTVWPCGGSTPPNASSLNYDPGADVPNLVVATLSPAGTVCLQTAEADAHLIVDLNGWIA